MKKNRQRVHNGSYCKLGLRFKNEVVMWERWWGCCYVGISPGSSWTCFCNVTSCCGLSKVLMLGLSSCFSTCCLAFCSMLIGSVALTDTCFINISLALALRLSASIIFLYCSTAFQKIMFSWLNSFFKNSWEKKNRQINGWVFLSTLAIYKLHWGRN